MKRNFVLAATLSLGFAFVANFAGAQQVTRKDPRAGNPAFAAYLETSFRNAAPNLTAATMNPAINVANYSFCTPQPVGSANITLQAGSGFRTRQDLINDVKAFRAQGGIAQCSLGGANSDVRLDNPQDIATFVNSLNKLYDEVPFDGIDIDLEGASFRLDPADQDFRNPTTPSVKNFITALDMFLDTQLAKNPKFFLTMAPETFFAGRAIFEYGPSSIGIPSGAALPFIEAFRDRLGLLYPQLYNSGEQFGLDGVTYKSSTTDFLVSQSEIFLQDFRVGKTPFMFKALKPEQVAFGLLANVRSGGSGFLAPDQVIQALRYMTQGSKAAVGTYKLVKQDGYPNFGGLFIFSANQDESDNRAFSNPVGQALGTLRSGAPTAAESSN